MSSRHAVILAAATLVVGLAAGCGRPLVLEDYYRKPNIENVTDFQGFDRVVASDEKDRVVGYVERESIVAKGFRELRDQYFVYDTRLVRIGVISHMGATYRYVSPDQTEEFIGNFTIPEGAKFLLGFAGNVKLKPYN